ncbi:TBC1 domain family member 12 isoform X3 [Meles meles]|uniref:TBC1 domain family member 12 isoform X3 n=1 Tax=Meles meles TaxID=9662 RepID=UPI001E69DCB9|nr:TBC1 domain family member 12 isoform X3 [Meles meles]
MVGPDDAGACSGRNPKLLPVPAPEPAGQDGKMIRATGGFGGGVGAVERPAEEEGEEEEETPPQQLLRRYLTAAGGQLEPGLCYCPFPAGQPRAPPSPAAPRSDACPRDSGSKHRGAEVADACAPRHRGMTNGDSGFLLGQDCRDLEEARGLVRAGGRDPRHHRLRLEGPGDEDADGADNLSDWAAPLEDPLRSCCLAAADPDKLQGAGSGSEGGRASDGGSSSEDVERPGAGAGGPEEGASAAASAERTSEGAGTEPRPGVSDVHVNSRNTFEEYEARTGRTCKPPPQSSRRKNFEFEPLSTTALILEDRPSNLPAKSVEEALRHRQEYDEMVAEAKKREIKDAYKRKKIMKERFKQEENIASAMVIWINEILPNWEVMRSTRRVRELWWQGLPPSVRGKVWSLAVGNELNITPELYEIFLSRAKERWKSFSETSSENDAEGVSVADREASLELIKLDISRTFPSLYIFQKGGPYHDVLHSILGAYTCYRPDVGYVQGMSFIAAVLILNLEEADAFIAFANLLNKPCQLAFFRVDHNMMLKYFATFEVFFEENLSKLFLHFKSYSLTPDIYLIDWIFTLYSKSLPLDLACRVWDVFCRDGEEFLFRTGLGILRLYEDILLQMDFIHIAQFLTKLPEDITSEKLFSCIAAIQMQNSTKKWTQVFASVMKDIKEGDKNNSPALKS